MACDAISAVNPPSLQTRSIVWTLQEAFAEYAARDQYSSASLVARLDGHALGFVSIRSSLTINDNNNNGTHLLSPRRRGLTILLSYRPSGASFTALGFFHTAIHMLVYAANGDPKARPTHGIMLYNADEDYALSVEPMRPDDAADELSLQLIIRVLGGLPDVMFQQRRGGRWEELMGVVKLDGVNVGRVRVERGGGGGRCLGGGT